MTSSAVRCIAGLVMLAGVAFPLQRPGSVAAQHPAAPHPLRFGAYYYAWWGSDGRHWRDGYLRHDLAIPQQPLLGEYDSRDAATVARQLAWLHRYGIGYLLCSWSGAGSFEDGAIRDHLLTAPTLGSTRVAIMYESLALLKITNGLIQFDAANEARLIADFDYLARTYFSNPHYYRIGGKPVVELYVTRIYRGAYARAIADLRQTIRQRYGYDLYLIGDEVDWDGTPVPERIKLFDAITSYTMYSDLQQPGWPRDTGFLSGVRRRYASFQAVARAAGVHFIPDVEPGFNDRGVRLAKNHYVLPRELGAQHANSYSLWKAYLPLAASFADPSLRTIFITSWNEWHEDSQIEPTASAPPSDGPVTYTQGYRYYSYGFKLLKMLRQFARAHGGKHS